jgi:CRP-like cAMP-binding protein
MSEADDTYATYGACRRLTQAELVASAQLGHRRAVPPGSTLFAEGDRNCDFFTTPDGTTAVVEARGTAEEQLLGTHGRGRFLGEVGLLTRQAALYSAIATEGAQVPAVPPGQLRALVATEATLGESTHVFEKPDDQVEPGSILRVLAAGPLLDIMLSDETADRLLLSGGISVAVVRTFRLIDARLQAVHREKWERAFAVSPLLI